jgi:hypothetical protein
VHLYILSPIDHTHATAAQLLNDAAVRDGLADHWDEILGPGLAQVNEGVEGWKLIARVHNLGLDAPLFRLSANLPETNAQVLHPFNATNAGRQIGAEKTTVGDFVGESGL